MDTLSADPNYIVMGSLLIRKAKPDVFDASFYVDPVYVDGDSSC
jgi:hypothetical protein